MGLFFDDLTEKRECTTCRYYSTFMGCGKGKMVGQMNAATCSHFENVYKYKEELKKQKEAERERERLQRERDDAERENERLRRENERLSSSSSSSSFSSPSSSYMPSSSSYDLDDDSFAFDDYESEEEMSPEEVEDALLEKFELLINEITKNFKPVIRQIRDLRKEDYSNNVVSIDDLDDFMESIKNLADTLSTANGSKKYVKKVKSLKAEYDSKVDSFLTLFVEEINWQFNNKHFNVAFALSESYLLVEAEGSDDLNKKCKAEYVSFSISKAHELIDMEKYEDAIAFLEPIKNEKCVKELLSLCYKKADKILISKAKSLIGERKYEEALNVLGEIGHTDVAELIEECESYIKEKKINDAKECISCGKYDEAVEILKTVKTSESASLMKKAREEKKKHLVEKVENLKKERKYDEAINVLRQLGGDDVNDAINSCRVDKAIWLYNSNRVNDAIRELKDIKTEESNTLIKRIQSNNKKKKTRVAGLIVLVFGIVFLIVGIVSAVKVNASMDSNVSFSEASRIIDQYTPWEVIGFLFGIPSFIVGLVLTLTSLKKYPIERIK